MRSFMSLNKFRRASQLTTKLASLASEESRRGYEKRMALLKQLVSAWENGENVCLAESKYSYHNTAHWHTS